MSCTTAMAAVRFVPDPGRRCKTQFAAAEDQYVRLQPHLQLVLQRVVESVPSHMQRHVPSAIMYAVNRHCPSPGVARAGALRPQSDSRAGWCATPPAAYHATLLQVTMCLNSIVFGSKLHDLAGGAGVACCLCADALMVALTVTPCVLPRSHEREELRRVVGGNLRGPGSGEVAVRLTTVSDVLAKEEGLGQVGGAGWLWWGGMRDWGTRGGVGVLA